MNGEIEAAIERLNERKRAGCAMGTDGPAVAADDDQVRLVWSGLDLDLDEAKGLTPFLAAAFLAGLSTGVSPAMVVMSLYMDGIVTGLLIAEARGKGDVG